MPNKTEERYIELDVGEISLVDSPANEETFAVIKRKDMEVDDMPEEIKETIKNETEEEASVEPTEKNEDKKKEVEKVSVETKEEKNEDILKAMNEIKDLVKNISDEKTAEAEVTKDDEKEEAATTEEAEKTKTEIKEPEKTVEEVETEEVSKVVNSLQIAIEKAKRFTPARMAALKDAVGNLQKLLTDLGESKKQVVETPPVESGLGDITKKIEEFTSTIEKKFSDFENKFNGINEKFEEIEKSRTPSTSLEEEGGTDGKKEVKKGGMWDNIL